MIAETNHREIAVPKIKIGSKSFDLALFLINLYFAMSYLAILLADLRYLKYSLPFIAGLFFFNKKIRLSYSKKISRKYLLFFLKLYCAIFGAYFFIQLFANAVTTRYFANCLFLLLPILFVFFTLPFFDEQKLNVYFRHITVLTILGYVLEKYESIIDTVANWKQLLVGIEDSAVASESNLYPFLLSFLLLFSLYYKYSWKQTFVISIFVLLAFKRIAILGILLFVVMLFIPNFYKTLRKSPKFYSVLFSIFSLIVILLYYFIADGYFDNYLFNNYGLYTNAFLQGRQVLYKLAIRNSDNLIIGSGIGSIDNLLVKNQSQINKITNLHSELLRWFLETGVFTYMLWMYMFFRNSLYTRFTVFLFFFLFILLLTDNVFIYFDCMFYVYILSIFSILKEGQLNASKNARFSRLVPQ